MNLVFCLYAGNNDVNGKAVRFETGGARIWNSRLLTRIYYIGNLFASNVEQSR